MGYLFSEELEFDLASRLQSDKINDVFPVSFHEWWSISCKFERSVYLRKNPGMPIPAQNGRQLLDARRNLNTQARGTMWMLLFKQLELNESEIMEASLCNNTEFVEFI